MRAKRYLSIRSATWISSTRSGPSHRQVSSSVSPERRADGSTLPGNMFREPAFFIVFQFFMLNVASSFLCAAAHNALFFLFGLTTWTIHFLHYFVTYCVLRIGRGVGFVPDQRIHWKEVLPLALNQFLITFLTSLCRPFRRGGGLYLLRLTDFAVTAFVILLSYKMFRGSALPIPSKRSLVMIVAVGASLSWLEFGILEYDNWGLIASPFNAFAQAAQIVLTFNAWHKLGCHHDSFMLHLSGLTSLVLLVPAAVATYQNFAYEILFTRAAWESIDYWKKFQLLMGMSLVFMCGMLYSKYWLMMNVSPESYVMLRHTKYTMASIGQWFTQNMAHATVYSSCGKAIAITGIFCYASERLRDASTDKRPVTK